MFTLEAVAQSHNPADAMAKYWLRQALVASSLTKIFGLSDYDIRLRAYESMMYAVIKKARAANPDEAGAVKELRIAQGEIEKARSSNTAKHKAVVERAAARLAVYELLYADFMLDLVDTECANDVLSYSTEYKPVGKLAEIVEGQSDEGIINCFPDQTTTYMHEDIAYARTGGEPFVVLYGDFDQVRNHITIRHHVDQSEIVSLIP